MDKILTERTSFPDFPVNIPIETTARITECQKQIWRSIDLALSPQYCSHCRHIKFDWEDTDDSIFGGEGYCQQCQAEVKFIDICQPES